MKITVEHNSLNKALSTVQAIAGQKRGNVPILTHVMIEAADNICTLTTTDLDIQAKSQLSAIVTQAGKITVPAQLLFGIVRTLPEGSQIDFTLSDDGQLSLVVGKSSFMLHTMPVDDFPEFDAGQFPHEFTLTADDLKFLLEKTRFAISADETRYYLNGIYFHVPANAKDKFRAVATDGYRLALSDIALPEGAGSIPGIIVPRKTIGELQRFIEDSDAEIKIKFSKTMVRYESEGITLTSKLVDGSFPDYARIIPDNNDKILAIKKSELKEALQRVAALFVNPPAIFTPLVKLGVEKNKLSLSGVMSGRGSVQEDIDIAYDSEPIEIGFNPSYLLDVMECMGNEIQIRMASPDVAAMLEDKSENKNQRASIYVLMPMRV